MKRSPARYVVSTVNRSNGRISRKMLYSFADDADHCFDRILAAREKRDELNSGTWARGRWVVVDTHALQIV